MTIQELKMLRYIERKILKGSYIEREQNIGYVEGGLIAREFFLPVPSGNVMPVPKMRIYYEQYTLNTKANN